MRGSRDGRVAQQFFLHVALQTSGTHGNDEHMRKARSAISMGLPHGMPGHIIHKEKSR